MKGPLRELGLFAGAGGGLLASRLLGWRTVCAVELDGYCQRLLAQRQRDGMLDPFPIWDDVRTFDGKPWNGSVDVVSGGFPCQDISSAGHGAGLAGGRSGLWFEMLRIISEVRPSFVFVENSPLLRTRGLDVVLTGLAELGFDAAWGVLGAHHFGAPIKRERLWVTAVAKSYCVDGEAKELGDSHEPSAHFESSLRARDSFHLACREGQVWERAENVESGVADGVADIVDRVRAAGNGQVPAVAALAWEVLSETLG